MENPIFDSVSGIISDSDIELTSLTLDESFAKLAEKLDRGWVNATRLQRKVVSYVGMGCGSNMKEYLGLQNRKYPLNGILMDARKMYMPYLSNVRTICRWVYYFVRYRKTMAVACEKSFVQTMRYCRMSGKRYSKSRRNRNNRWTSRDKEYLLWILWYRLHIFIDEIQTDLEILTSKKWSISHIYPEIRRTGFNCKKTYLGIAQVDQMERLEFKLGLHS